MALTGILILIFLVCLAMLWNEGTWSNALTLVNVVLAALIATNYFEPVAAFLNGKQPSYTYLLDYLSLWGLFFIAFGLLRAVTDYLSNTQVKLKMPIEQGGRVITSAAVGWVMICFTLMTLHTAPLARTAFKGGFQAEPMSNNFLGMAPDRMWLGYVQHRSKTALATSPPRVFDPEGEFIFKYGTRRRISRSNRRYAWNRAEVARDWDGMMPQTESSFSETQDRQLVGEYRSLSMLAVAAFVFGVLSAGALLYPGVWVVPVLAVLFGLFALRAVKKSDNLVGALPASAGICLALFFLSWGVSEYYFARWVIYSEAQVVGRRWLQWVVEGEDEIAHQAMLHPAARQSAGLSVDDYYAMDDKAREDKEEVFTAPPAADVAEMGNDAQIAFVKNLTQDVDVAGAQLIRQVYRVTGKDGRSVDVMLTLTREQRDDLGRATWIVADIGHPDRR